MKKKKHKNIKQKVMKSLRKDMNWIKNREMKIKIKIETQKKIINNHLQVILLNKISQDYIN